MKNLSEATKVGALVGTNFVGAGVQAVQAAQETAVAGIESYLRVALLLVQIIIGVATAIYVVRRLKTKPSE